MQPDNTEFQSKIKILRKLLDEQNIDGLLLRRVSSFAWATCGVASYVNTAVTEGTASLLITREHLYLVTNNIEAPRLEQEEKLDDQGWEFYVSPWETPLLALKKLTEGLKLVSDVPFPGARDISSDIARLRARLRPEEIRRFRQLGSLCAESMSAAVQKIEPGISEFRMAALLGSEARQRGIQPVVNLIATDERVFRFRHPLPTEKRLNKYAMLVLGGRRWGLVCSITRLVHIGPLEDDLRRRISATAQVNAALISYSRPGRSLGNIIAMGQQAYAREGFSDEWRQHHQGGVAGYEPREFLATPTSTDIIVEGQCLAWNPSIAGAKVEDTILVGEQSNEVLTTTALWPVLNVQAPGQPESVPCSLALEI